MLFVRIYGSIEMKFALMSNYQNQQELPSFLLNILFLTGHVLWRRKLRRLPLGGCLLLRMQYHWTSSLWYGDILTPWSAWYWWIKFLYHDFFVLSLPLSLLSCGLVLALLPYFLNLVSSMTWFICCLLGSLTKLYFYLAVSLGFSLAKLIFL